MRILFINTTDIRGGAAVVVQRLRKGLHRDFDIEDRLVVKIKDSDDENTHRVLSSTWQVYAEKVIDKLTKTAGLLYQSFPFSSRRILEEVRDFRPDIIHLHNTHGSYFPTPLIRTLSRHAPLVWTLHDMWSFTGNSAHTFGNMSWKHMRNDHALTKISPTIGINTGAWLLRQKRSVYKDARLTVVCPSGWLQELALQSPVFEGKQVLRIYNGVDTTLFTPQDKTAARRKLGLDPHRKTVMFSARFLGSVNIWKGGADLEGILRHIDRLAGEKINFLALGEGRLDDPTPFHNLEVHYKNYVHGEENMRDCYNASDLFIYPTRADNLPNSLVESIACGTPAVTFDIGGNKEIIGHDRNGIILPPFDLEAFATNTLALLYDDNRRAAFSQYGRELACRKFDMYAMARQYFDLYKSIVPSLSPVN
ncbi:MAG TPA: glycosyltransferase [Puia sp.]|nr:glycosyltransferase [Puia sp.]